MENKSKVRILSRRLDLHWPGAADHMKELRKKFCAGTGILQHLNKLKIDRKTLVKINTAFIRPVFEYASSAFHLVLSAEQSEDMERMQ